MPSNKKSLPTSRNPKSELLSPRVPYQDKVRISQKVKHLTKEKLGELVELIRSQAPKAFKENNKETCQIFVDHIPKSFFIKIAK